MKKVLLVVFVISMYFVNCIASAQTFTKEKKRPTSTGIFDAFEYGVVVDSSPQEMLKRLSESGYSAILSDFVLNNRDLQEVDDSDEIAENEALLNLLALVQTCKAEKETQQSARRQKKSGNGLLAQGYPTKKNQSSQHNKHNQRKK